jgi:hypothetical protein
MLNMLKVDTSNFMVVANEVYELVRKLPKVQRQNQKAVLSSAVSQWMSAERNDKKELDAACARLQRVVAYFSNRGKN